MTIVVHWLQEIKFVAGLEIRTFPAALISFFLAALPHLAERRSPSNTTPLVTAELDHSTKDFIAFVIILKCLAEALTTEKIGEFLVF